MDRVNIGSDNGLSPIQRQAIIWTNAGICQLDPIHESAPENIFSETAAILSRGRWANSDCALWNNIIIDSSIMAWKKCNVM